MDNKLNRRRIRYRFAPPGSHADRWIINFNQFLFKVRTGGLTKSLADILYRLSPAFIRRPLDNYHLKKLAPVREELQEIIQMHPDIERIIIFPPSLDWNVQLFQRPQQLAIAFANQNTLVFYLQLKIQRGAKPFQRISERLYLCNTPLQVFQDLKSPTIYILTWNSKYISTFDSSCVIYDYVDEIEAFYGNHTQMYKDHQALIQSADLVATTAVRLHEKVLPDRPDAILCPNGVNYQHFVEPFTNTDKEPPKDLRPILATGNPVIGYYGALAKWFDYELVTQVAQIRSELSFVIIGPDYDSTLPPTLIDLPNVHWLGVKSYQELPYYLYYFDVAMIPFQLNDITHAVSPLKLFEYMAAGKPIVITPMQESMRYSGVLVASSAREFSDRIDKALSLKDDSDYSDKIISIAQENTWDARARQILDSLCKTKNYLTPPTAHIRS